MMTIVFTALCSYFQQAGYLYYTYTILCDPWWYNCNSSHCRWNKPC